MNYKSKAITLTYSKQGESSIICKIFTEEQGLQTFIIKGVRSSKSKKKIGLFQALQLVKINATYSEKRGLQYLSEISVDEPTAIEKVNMHKNFIAVFIAEITAKVLQENERNIPLFNFIWNTKKKLYLSDNVSDNFVLLFMLHLSKYLGFYPSIDNVNATYFNLETAEFSNDSLNLNIYLDKEKSTILKSLLKGKEVKIKQKIKSELLKDIMRFFHLNHYNLQNITSHLIIESLRICVFCFEKLFDIPKMPFASTMVLLPIVTYLLIIDFSEIFSKIYGSTFLYAHYQFYLKLHILFEMSNS